MNKKNNQLIPINTRLYRTVLAILVTVFFFYNLLVYSTAAETRLPPMSRQAVRGELLWQKSNCSACHQLYGLGGYLGPDLTNIISTKGKGPLYVKTFINAGVKAMPIFNFTEEEKEDIVAFLTYVDKTGYFPNAEAQLQKTGWVDLKYKTPQRLENE